MYKQLKNIFTGLILDDQIFRLSDCAFIPFDPDNTDYQAFLKYQAEGGKVYGADEEVPDGQRSLE
jgi:hypothetical protein